MFQLLTSNNLQLRTEIRLHHLSMGIKACEIKKGVHALYLWRAFEVHPRNRQSGDVHRNTPIQIERTHNKKEASAYNRPKKKKKMNSLEFQIKN